MFWRKLVTGASSITFISAGGGHTCSVWSDGTARCWGNNKYGQIGNGTTVSAYLPVAVSGLSGVQSIAASYYHSCALLSDRTVKCWGYSFYGQLGDGATSTFVTTPVAVSGLTNAISVSVGDNYHSCSVISDGTVRCWGTNASGQIGNGTSTQANTPAQVSGISNAVSAAAGGNQSCAILSDGTGRCWGNNSYGELGNGSTTKSLTPVPVSGLNAAILVSGGGNHNCALISTGTIRCWGRDTEGQLGNGSTTNSNVPVTVSGINSAVAIAAGYYFSCAVLSDGTARCWGKNDFGQLGNGNTTNSSVPVTVSGVSGAISIATGDYHACAQLADGSARCWGRNSDGQLANGRSLNNTVPASAEGVTSQALSLGAGFSNSCVLLPDGTVRCWGQNDYGQLGNGCTVTSASIVTVSGLSGVASLGVGDQHGCAVLSDGTARCWGRNSEGELGNGASSTYSTTPVTVSGLSGILSIASGGVHSCALLSNGTVKCWGGNTSGQLGNAASANSSVPVTVSGISNAVAVGAGQYHSCAILSDSTVRCWGSNSSGQLGHGGAINTYTVTPVTTSGLSGAVAIALASNHSCALLSDGTAQCWGHNSYGELGDGTSVSNRLTPVIVSGFSNGSSISTRSFTSCATLTDGTLRCWGYASGGMLGNGSTTNSLTPTVVSGISNAVWVSVGTSHVCALLSNGYPWCWGSNVNSQLGKPWSAYDTAPAQVYGYDHDTGSALTGISGTGPVAADGSAQSTISIQLTQGSGTAWSGVTPTFTATDSLGRNVMGACSVSDASGQSTCSLKSTYAEVKELWLTSPIRALAYPSTGPTFTGGAPAKLLVKGPAALKQSVCSSRPYQIVLADVNDNPAAATGNFTVTVSGLGSAQIYSDPLCTQALSTSVGFITGVSGSNFYLKDTTAESITVQGAATGLTTGSLGITISP